MKFVSLLQFLHVEVTGGRKADQASWDVTEGAKSCDHSSTEFEYPVRF